MAAKLKTTEDKIRSALKMLASMEIITIETTKTHSVITLKNWDKYQSQELDFPKEIPNGAPTEPQRIPTEEEGKKGSIEEKESAPAGPAAWNPFSSLTAAFKAHGIQITQRKGDDIGVVNACGRKQGKQKFEAVLEAYCTDAFIKKNGRSIGGFINAMDRIGDTVSTAPSDPRDICRLKGHATEIIEGINKKCSRCKAHLGLTR